LPCMARDYRDLGHATWLANWCEGFGCPQGKAGRCRVPFTEHVTESEGARHDQPANQHLCVADRSGCALPVRPARFRSACTVPGSLGSREIERPRFEGYRDMGRVIKRDPGASTALGLEAHRRHPHAADRIRCRMTAASCV
jgi:hypothetical protein